MATPQELETRFWKALEDDRTVMLGVEGVQPRPMTALSEDRQAPIWFFTSTDTLLAQTLERTQGLRAMLTFASKGHDLFATVDGTLAVDNDRAVVDRLWSPFIAAWFEGGKDDPKLRLLRLDPAGGEVWENEHSLLAGIRMLLGMDPKRSYEGKTANVDLH
jgi:general stress protein 26